MSENIKEYDISVIVPVYNCEQYISQCIDSILAQDKDKIEIVVVNDGSTDHTPDILNEYANKYDNINVVSQPNGGLAQARITGIKNAHGSFIGWVDADDFVKRTMYSTLYNIAINDNCDFVYCDYDFYPKKVSTKEKWFQKYEGVRNWRFIDRNTQCWNTLISRSLLDEIDIIDKLGKYEEYGWIAPMLGAKKISYTEKKLYFYRVGNVTMSGGFHGKLKHYAKNARLSSTLKNILNGTGYENELGPYMDYRYIYTLIQLQIVAAIDSNRQEYKYAKKELKRMNFKNNPYTKLILDDNHGKLKSFVMRNIITFSYLTARIVTKLVFK